jgi:hypothetical protein
MTVRGPTQEEEAGGGRVVDIPGRHFLGLIALGGHLFAVLLRT